ncbi:MAG: hypothetical protein IT317_00030 [Anaerolineales bacterium]|nr:hypothetical protein [Anaerolineales bacterium]
MDPQLSPINRRTFLRLAAYCLPALAALRLPEAPPLAMPSAMPQSMAYGAGPYGAGAYAGHAVYLPAIQREGA